MSQYGHKVLPKYNEVYFEEFICSKLESFFKLFVCDFPLLCMALFLVQLLIKESLVQDGVQVLTRRKSLIPAPLMCLGVLLHGLDARGEEMSPKECDKLIKIWLDFES